MQIWKQSRLNLGPANSVEKRHKLNHLTMPIVVTQFTAINVRPVTIVIQLNNNETTFN